MLVLLKKKLVFYFILKVILVLFKKDEVEI